MTIIIIDGSYYVFYRYYAIMAWWKRAHKEIYDSGVDPIDSPEFVSTFCKTFSKHIQNFIKTFKISKDDYTLYVAKDCSQKDIWRHAIISNYKATRDHSTFKGGPFFKLAYDELFEALGAKLVKHPHLEADDCVACLANYYSDQNEQVYILANDHDYMQLINTYIQVYTLKGASLCEHKNFYDSSEKALFMKIILGDKSDNIPPVFKKCGVKTAEKYYENKELFQKKLETNNDSMTQLETNRSVIDFKYIPEIYINEFKNTYNLN